MAEQLLSELEHASKIVQAPPSVVTNEQRHAAEELFLKFKRTKHAFKTCTYLLEHSKNDYVLFHAASTIKESMVREWPLISIEDVENMRKFLLHYVIQRPELPAYVREQMLQAVAVIFKRATIDTKDIDRDSLFTDVTQLISSGNLTMQMTACSILTALLNEYSTTSKSSSVGLTWEYHIKCKKYFEDIELEQVFLFCIQVLTELEKQTAPLSRETTAVLNRFLAIAEHVLSWQFTPSRLMRRHVGSFMNYECTSLRPGTRWRSTLLSKDLLQLILKLHHKIRFNSEMSHHCLQCLAQLASMNGEIFATDKMRMEYVKNFLEPLLNYIAVTPIHDYEAINVATIFENLLLQTRVAVFSLLPVDLLQGFLRQLTKLTCEFGQAAALDEAMHKDDTVYMEAYEKMLRTWMRLLRDGDPLSAGQLHQPATEIFNTYVQCHLSLPEGNRNKTDSGDSEDLEDYEENDEDDHDLFKDQLSCIGLLGRRIPSHSLPLLARLLEARVSHLSKVLQNVHTSQVNIDMKSLNNLNEDLHWLLLISACLLSDEYEGETPLIPHEIMEHSLEQANTVNVQSTVKLLATSGDCVNGLPSGAENEVDSSVRLIASVFSLCGVEMYAAKAGLVHYLSPEVTRSLVWFFTRWLRCYLLPDENHYSEISMTFVTCFGRDTDGAKWVVKCLLDKIASILSVWTAEPELVKETAQMLVTLVEVKVRCSCVIQYPTVWDLAKQLAANQLPLRNLPSAAKRLLSKALVLAGLSIEDEDSKINYWKELINGIHSSLRAVTCQESFLKTFHDQQTKTQLLSLLESLCGVGQGAEAVNTNEVFTILHPALQDLVPLLDVYHNYEDMVQLIIEVFSETVQNMIDWLNVSNSKKIYEVCLSLIQMYAKHTSGKRRTVTDEDDEDKFNDLLLLIDLLMHMLSKDFLDFAAGEEPGEVPVAASDVVLYGLNIIIPLMDSEVMKFPVLCTQYYKLVSFIADLFPDKLCLLPAELYRNMMMSVDLGLVSFGTDVCRSCLELLFSVAEHICVAGSQGQVEESMIHFLRVVFQLLLTDTFDMELIDPAGRALFALICCHPVKYQALVQEVLHRQTDQQYFQRLLVAFNELTPPSLELKSSRLNRIQFMENLDRFLINVRGFLCVK